MPTPDPAPTGAEAAACATLSSALPATVQGQSRRTTEPAGTTTTAAWGDPPIVLRCGVGRPEGLVPTGDAVEIDGVAWYPQQLSAGYRFTTLERSPRVEVTVPDAYSPEVDPLVDLSPAVAQAVPRAGGTSAPSS